MKKKLIFGIPVVLLVIVVTVFVYLVRPFGKSCKNYNNGFLDTKFCPLFRCKVTPGYMIPPHTNGFYSVDFGPMGSQCAEKNQKISGICPTGQDVVDLLRPSGGSGSQLIGKSVNGYRFDDDSYHLAEDVDETWVNSNCPNMVRYNSFAK